MQLYFGPKLYYFFHDGKGTFKYRGPPEFLKFFKTTPVKEVHNVAFGTGVSFFISYTDPNGIGRALFDLDDDYPKLYSWLIKENLAHDYASVSISLGLNGAFFAWSNQGHRWHNIPDGALERYQKFTKPDLFLRCRVKTIDIGYGDTFLGIGVDNVWFWDLKDQYPHFASLGVKENIPNAQWVTLNPFAADQHFAVFADGSVHYSLPPGLAVDVAQLFQQYAARLAQQTQQRPPAGRLQQGSIAAPGGYSNTAFGSGGRPPDTSPPPQFNGPSPMDFFNQYPNNAQSPVGGNSGNNFGVPGPSGGAGGNSPDVNQAMATMQSSMDALNSVANVTGQGMGAVNQLASNGLMVGQLTGQLATAATGCSVM
ncbi:hypothetical protein BAUCODRAFT_453112 [Baudoinia panamericana UAMH 10762]|uniref:Uncharacterized protein n=1 Tax=Baudoinia panamericana (strain UAMH 10762) TaxID=717646 RepID=M2LSK7_BAUPA|nr:uncharacterized protein BAUCODRAFT_453112 [Baudoinia panamericana UAMH 10762]EMC97462.1 hypothetical protein BAUCODRAFT_453112 [Baudoinia panamericana UAMH 10762]